MSTCKCLSLFRRSPSSLTSPLARALAPTRERRDIPHYHRWLAVSRCDCPASPLPQRRARFAQHDDNSKKRQPPEESQRLRAQSPTPVTLRATPASRLRRYAQQSNFTGTARKPPEARSTAAPARSSRARRNRRSAPPADHGCSAWRKELATKTPPRGSTLASHSLLPLRASTRPADVAMSVSSRLSTDRAPIRF